MATPNQAGESEPQRSPLITLRTALLIVGAFLIIGVLHPSATQEMGRIPVAAMQGNFSPLAKREDLPHIVRTFRDLTAQAHNTTPKPPALYVWSESAAPTDAINDFATRNLLQSLSDQYNGAILTGTRSADPTTGVQTNTSALFVPQTQTPLRYDKVQLVPFGEFIPFRSLFPPAISRSFGFFEEDVQSGRVGDTLKTGNLTLGAFICYESMYPVYARGMSKAGANLLITQSNDAWFQCRAAMEQHLSAVAFRAAENRKSVVRSTTTGITAFLDERGTITQRLPVNTPGVLLGEIALRDGVTLYARFGDWFVLVCGVLTLIPLLQRKRLSAHATDTL